MINNHLNTDDMRDWQNQNSPFSKTQLQASE